MSKQSKIIGKCWVCRRPVRTLHHKRKVLDGGMKRLVHEHCYESRSWPEQMLADGLGATYVQERKYQPGDIRKVVTGDVWKELD